MVLVAVVLSVSATAELKKCEAQEAEAVSTLLGSWELDAEASLVQNPEMRKERLEGGGGVRFTQDDAERFGDANMGSVGYNEAKTNVARLVNSYHETLWTSNAYERAAMTKFNQFLVQIGFRPN